MTDSDSSARRAEMLSNRVRKRARHLRKWARREGVTCYRLYDRDIPEVPLVVDWYDGRVHIAEFRRERGDESASGSGQWLDAMAEAVASALGVGEENLYVKARQRQRGSWQYQRQGSSGERFEVSEGDMRYYVNLADYLDTGLFLDHRQTRRLVAGQAAGASFLNLFCYTGSFTACAAAAGARETLSVDLSHTYLRWAEDNLALNRAGGPGHRFLRADVLEYLRDPRRPKAHFDLAFLDPPAFSNSKSMRDVLDIQRDHVFLIERTLEMLRPGGVLYFSTGRRRFRFEADLLRAAGVEVEDLTEATTPPDFRAGRAHRCWRIARA